MARVKLSEFRAKSILVEGYEGYTLTSNNLDDELSRIPDGNYVLKVDQGIKKRGKQGLVAVNITPDQVRENASKWQNLGFSRYILEPLVPHEQSHEKYLAFQRTREGIIISFSELGGMDVEDNADSIKSFNELQISDLAKYSGISEEFIKNIILKMNENHFSFLEINPLVIKDGQLILLDAAVLVDSAGEYFTNMWSENDIVEASQKTDAELRVRELDDNSPAALKLTVLNKDASLWLLLSGGGASITIADTIQAEGLGNQLGNYGEYSGGPTTEETYLYTKEILNLVLSSKAPKKAVIIAGGVANFTDVAKTFKGIIQALNEVAEELRQQKVKVFVRRGGPNEKEGLKNMEEFLRSNDLYGSVYGSDVVLTEAASEAIKYVGESK